MTKLILNNAQFKAIYSTMCELNNVNGILCIEFKIAPDRSIKVWEDKEGQILVKYLNNETFRVINEEVYATQDDFKWSYNPNGDI